MKTSSTFSNAAAAAAAAPQMVVRSDLIGARRFERSPKDFDRAIFEEIAPKIKRCLPVLDERKHHGGIAQHGTAMGRIRLSEVADLRNDEGRRRSDRGKLRSSTEADYARLLERQNAVVLSRNDNLLAYGRDDSGEKISGQHPGVVYRRRFDEADLPIRQQEGDASSSSAAVVSSTPASPRRAHPEPSSASLTTGRQPSHPKMLLGTSSDKTVYQRPKGKRGKRARDEIRKSRGRRETRTTQHAVVCAPCFSTFGPLQQNGSERQTEDRDLMAFDDGVLVGGFDATPQTSSIRDITGFPSSQVSQDQNLLGRGVTRYRTQDRWNSFISANLDTDMDAKYRFENTDKDNAVTERGPTGFAELQSVHEEDASDSQSLVSDREDQRQGDDDDDNRNESTEVGAFLRSSKHDPSLSNAARLTRKDAFSGLNDLFDDSTIETNSVIRKHAIRSQGEGGCRRISSFKFLMPKIEEKKHVEKVTLGGTSKLHLQRSCSDGAMTYPKATPGGGNRPPVPAGFVASLAANASDSGEETVTDSSCASKTEFIGCANHSPALIPYESLHASYAHEPFATATVLDSSRNIPTAGYANVFKLKVPILCPKLRRSADTLENFITEFSEDARSQNNSLPDGCRHFDSIRDPFPKYLAGGPIVLGFQMKDRDAGPHRFRDSFGRNFLADRCLDDDRSMPTDPATAMPPALLSRRPQSNDGHAQSPRSHHPHRFIPTYVNQQQTELDVPWTMDGYPGTAAAEDDDDNDDYWEADYTDPCLCLHGDLMRGSVEEWEASDARVYNGRLRRRSRTQRRQKTEKRNPGRSTFTKVKPLENPRLVEEIYRNADSQTPPNNTQAPPTMDGASSYAVATNSPRLQSNREVVPVTEGSRLPRVDIAARSRQGGDFDGVHMRCPGIEIVTSEDERRSMINHMQSTAGGNATNHSSPASARNVEGAGHAQTPRGERAAGESNGATPTQTSAEEHERKLEKRMRLLGIQQAFCLMLVTGAYIFLSIIYFK